MIFCRHGVDSFLGELKKKEILAALPPPGREADAAAEPAEPPEEYCPKCQLFQLLLDSIRRLEYPLAVSTVIDEDRAAELRADIPLNLSATPTALKYCIDYWLREQGCRGFRMGADGLAVYLDNRIVHVTASPVTADLGEIIRRASEILAPCGPLPDEEAMEGVFGMTLSGQRFTLRARLVQGRSISIFNTNFEPANREPESSAVDEEMSSPVTRTSMDIASPSRRNPGGGTPSDLVCRRMP